MEMRWLMMDMAIEKCQCWNSPLCHHFQIALSIDEVLQKFLYINDVYALCGIDINESHRSSANIQSGKGVTQIGFHCCSAIKKDYFFTVILITWFGYKNRWFVICGPSCCALASFSHAEQLRKYSHMNAMLSQNTCLLTVCQRFVR